MENYEFSLKRLWLMPIMMIFIVLLLVALDSPLFDADTEYGFYSITEGWDIVNENTGVSYEDASLWDINIGKAGNYKPVTMENVIPDVDMPSKALVFRTYYCSVEVYIDNKLIYTYAKDIMEDGRMCPKHYNKVPLTADYLGKPFKIVLIPNEEFSFSGLSPVYFGNVEEVYRSIFQDKRLPLLIGTFLCIFGFAVFITSLYMFVYHKGSMALAFAANISFNIGTYVLAFNDIYNFIADADEFYTFIEYFSLYCIPLSIIAFLISSNMYFRNKFFAAVTAINIIFIAYTVIMHVTGINHICNFLQALHIGGILEVILFVARIVVSIVRIRRNKDDIMSAESSRQSLISSIVFLIGVLIFLVCVFIDLILYIYKRQIGYNIEMDKNITFFIIGSLCFVLSILLNYFFYSIEHINVENQKHRLEGIAYNDDLTGLSNRARCELEIASINKKNREGYSIISIDVDRLKTVNDTLGHHMGDNLLKEFSDALKASLTDADLLGRMGGDEFIAIYKKGSEDICKSAMTRLVEEIRSRNTIAGRKYELSFSYGYAVCKSGGSINPRDIYMEADKNMYEMKKIHHKEGIAYE